MDVLRLGPLSRGVGTPRTGRSDFDFVIQKKRQLCQNT